jgi:hypothetical protein
MSISRAKEILVIPITDSRAGFQSVERGGSTTKITSGHAIRGDQLTLCQFPRHYGGAEQGRCSAEICGGGGRERWDGRERERDGEGVEEVGRIWCRAREVARGCCPSKRPSSQCCGWHEKTNVVAGRGRGGFLKGLKDGRPERRGYSWGARISRRLIWQQEGITKEAKGWGVGALGSGRFGMWWDLEPSG